MPRKRRSRIYLRGSRYWGDFRDIGGSREPLIPKDQLYATSDPDIAAKLASDRVTELEQRKRNRSILGVDRTSTLADFSRYHLERKAESSEVTTRWIEESEQRLKRAIEFFGSGRELHSIAPRDVQDWVTHLSKMKGRGRGVSKATIRHHLNGLSNLFRRAVSEGYVTMNPVAALIDKPQPARHDSPWLEIHEAALYLEAARTWDPDPDLEDYQRANPAFYEIVATLLLTGGRESEVLGLEVEDVSFDRSTITFRPNKWRRLKTRTSHRTIPLWPQLHAILQEYIFVKGGPKSGLLFPAHRGTSKGKMLTNIRKALDSVGERVGWKRGEIRTRRFRTSYTAARLQTLDRGAPVAVWTVARELGHSSTALVERTYGKLGQVRHRSEVVEFRIEQHESRPEIRDKLRALNSA